MNTYIRLTTTATLLLGFSLFNPGSAVAASFTASSLETLSSSQGSTSQKIIPVVEQNYPQCNKNCAGRGGRGAGTR